MKAGKVVFRGKVGQEDRAGELSCQACHRYLEF